MLVVMLLLLVMHRLLVLIHSTTTSTPSATAVMRLILGIVVRFVPLLSTSTLLSCLVCGDWLIPVAQSQVEHILHHKSHPTADLDLHLPAVRRSSRTVYDVLDAAEYLLNAIPQLVLLR